MTVQTFRKKPVEIQAVQLTDDADWEAIATWCGGKLVNHRDPSDEYTTELVIPTLEGDMHAREDWWILRGVRGEFYPCEPGIFAETYDAVVPYAAVVPPVRAFIGEPLCGNPGCPCGASGDTR